MPLSDPRFEFSPTPIHSLEAGHTVQLADLPAFGVCGRSGSGKTALIEAVIPQLRKQGLKVAVVKGTTREVAVESPDLATSLRDLSTHHDLVLVESNHASPLPKVWLPDASESEIPTKVPGVVAHLSRDCDRVQSLLSILKDWLPLQWDKTPVFGCVLIGGKSRRMGYPKHLIQKNGKPWIQRTVELLEQTTSQVAIVGGKFEMAGCVHLADAPDSDGPMAGVLAALRWAPQVSWLVVACDLPRLSLPSLEWLLSTRSPGVWATLPQLTGEGRRIESLLAHYDWRARRLIEDLAAKDDFSLSHLGFHNQVSTPAPPEGLEPAWQDVDTPAELEQVGYSPSWSPSTSVLPE